MVDRLATEMLEKLPQDYLPHEIRDRIKKMGITDPLNIFLRQEVSRFTKNTFLFHSVSSASSFFDLMTIKIVSY